MMTDAGGASADGAGPTGAANATASEKERDALIAAEAAAIVDYTLLVLETVVARSRAARNPVPAYVAQAPSWRIR